MSKYHHSHLNIYIIYRPKSNNYGLNLLHMYLSTKCHCSYFDYLHYLQGWNPQVKEYKPHAAPKSEALQSHGLSFCRQIQKFLNIWIAFCTARHNNTCPSLFKWTPSHKKYFDALLSWNEGPWHAHTKVWWRSLTPSRKRSLTRRASWLYVGVK